MAAIAAQPEPKASPLIAPSSRATKQASERGRWALLEKGAAALLAASAAAAGLVLGAFGRYGWGLVLLVAVGLTLWALSPSWLDRFATRLVRGIALAWVFAVVLSLWVVPSRRAARARADIGWLRQQIDAYADNVGSLPPSLGELRFRSVERFGMSQPRDPWGRPYLYAPGGNERRYQLTSLGADGTPSDDDVR